VAAAENDGGRPCITPIATHKMHRNAAASRARTGEVPYVANDNRRFYSDRFYLDAPTGLLEYNLEVNKKTRRREAEMTRIEYCNKCGNVTEEKRVQGVYGGSPPQIRHRPHFDKAKFINSLDLKAAIIGTFTVGRLDSLSKEYPALFPSLHGEADIRHVPTLVLHGEKAFTPERWLQHERSQQKYAVFSNPQTRDAADSNVDNNLAIGIRGGGESQDSCNSRDFEDNSHYPNFLPEVLAGLNEKTDEEKSPLRYMDLSFRKPRTPARQRKRKATLQKCDQTDSKNAASHLDAKPENGADEIDPDALTAALLNGETIRSNNANTSIRESKSEAHSSCDRNFADGSLMSEAGTTKCSIETRAAVPSSNTDNAPEDRQESKRTTVENNRFTSRLEGSTSDDGSYHDSRMDRDEYIQRSNCPQSPPHHDQQPLSRGSAMPSSHMGGEVYFTQILARWTPPANAGPTKEKGESAVPKGEQSATYSDDDEFGCHQPQNKDTTPVQWGVNHPKFFLLFEKDGSLTVIISTSNLTSTTAIEGSWVQRFKPKELNGQSSSNVDYGMPSDFGIVLADFLEKQSAAAANGMVPEVFMRRFVDRDISLQNLSNRYHFEEAQVHLVSTVPGDYPGQVPVVQGRRPQMTYGANRVESILKRIDATGLGKSLNDGRPWIPETLRDKRDQLLIQPTSLGGNWKQDDLEALVEAYLCDEFEKKDDASSIIERLNIIWPDFDYFHRMKASRRATWKKCLAQEGITKEAHQKQRKGKDRNAAQALLEDKSWSGDMFVFLSSEAFSKLERSVIGRMSLFQMSNNMRENLMPYTSVALHIKSVCRLLKFSGKERCEKKNEDEGEYIQWFLLTSACLSKGAQGRITPRRMAGSNSMSYTNFELGVMFCSRLVGDKETDRLYVSDPKHVRGCQCGQGRRMYRERFTQAKKGNLSFLNNVKKVHLPIPFSLNPESYQQDPDSYLMSWTPYMNEIPEGTGCIGNMQLTPLGQEFADQLSRDLRF